MLLFLVGNPVPENSRLQRYNDLATTYQRLKVPRISARELKKKVVAQSEYENSCRSSLSHLSMALPENGTASLSSYVPHYLLSGDPFASKLSKEADIVAAFYICIV
ncbi:hypothetical protein JZ751_005151, partial [Albula glossodonta]